MDDVTLGKRTYYDAFLQGMVDVSHFSRWGWCCRTNWILICQSSGTNSEYSSLLLPFQVGLYLYKLACILDYPCHQGNPLQKFQTPRLEGRCSSPLSDTGWGCVGSVIVLRNTLENWHGTSRWRFGSDDVSFPFGTIFRFQPLIFHRSCPLKHDAMTKESQIWWQNCWNP